MNNVLLFVISLFVVFSIPFTSIWAQDITTAPIASPSPTIQYKLPYPGMLPDSPLYKIKVLRDKIMLFFIADPHKKAQYHLHLANKKLLMSKMLVDKGTIPLARETALKGENEMTLMTFVYKNSARTPQPEFLREVTLATTKHQELLKDIISKVSVEDAKTFQTILEFSQRNLDELQNLAQTAD